MNNRNYTGPNAIGVPKDQVPDWLDHTANAIQNVTITDNTAPDQDPGPNAKGAEGTTEKFNA